MKDLTVIEDRELKDIILVDNSSYSFAPQLENGVPVLSYYEGANDDELLHLERFLKKIARVKDVLKYLKSYFRLEEVAQAESLQQVKHRFITLQSKKQKKKLKA